MKTGRPTKYKAEYATDEFIAKYIRHCKRANELISLCGFACYIKVCEETLQEWRRKHPEFSVPLAKIKQMSKQSLINKGLLSKYSPHMAKFVLSANHGMAEKQEFLGKDGRLLQINMVMFGKPKGANSSK